jgi:hypothetical protein
LSVPPQYRKPGPKGNRGFPSNVSHRPEQAHSRTSESGSPLPDDSRRANQ